MIICLDVCVHRLIELELWRAGFQVPVRAAKAEPDESWLARAVAAGCDVVVSMDRGACHAAVSLGMVAVKIMSIPRSEMYDAIADAFEHVLSGTRSHNAFRFLVMRPEVALRKASG